MAQEQEKQKSSIDHANDLINFGQNAYYGGKNLARLGKLISAGRTALVAASTSEIWGPVAIVLIIILVPTFLIVMGGKGQASETSEPVTVETSINTTKTNLNVHFYCQYQGSWSINSCDIISKGCDPTSLAIIFTSFGDTQWTPYFTAANNGFMGCFQATTQVQTSNAIDRMSTFGYTKADSVANGSNFDLNRAKAYIEAGYLIHAAANVYYRAGTRDPLDSATAHGGHSFVITGVDPVAQTVTALDPTFCNSDTNYVTKTMNVSNDVLFNDNGNGWFWAYPIKKVVNTQ